MFHSEQSDILHNTYPLHILKCGSRGWGTGGPDPLKTHKATKLAFNVGPTSARQGNVI